MPGFDKMGAYQTVDSTDREDESNSQCQSQLDDTNNVQGMFFRIIISKFFFYLFRTWQRMLLPFFLLQIYLKLHRFRFFFIHGL